MALIIETNIACDNCGNLFRPNTSPLKGTELRKLARAAGWVRPCNADVCPKCAPSNSMNPRANKMYNVQLLHKKFAGVKTQGEKHFRIDEYELQWPGNKLHNAIVCRSSVADVSSTGYERTRCRYSLKTGSKQFNTIKQLIDHYKDL